MEDIDGYVEKARNSLSVELKACVREKDADVEHLTIQFNRTKCRKS